jgi:exonuclease III
MKGVIWNCQGLGKPGKSEFIHELINKEKVDFISLQETNKREFGQNWLLSLSGNKMFKWISSPPNGKFGGLLVSFNSDTFEVSNIQIKDFMIVCVIHHKNKNISWTFANVYGVAQAVNKDNFLIELAATCSHCKGPILLGGDFNILRSSDDKNKPYVANRWTLLFNAIIDHHSLVELDLTDRKFTWSNNRNPPTFEKLDRFLMSLIGIYYTAMLGLQS